VIREKAELAGPREYLLEMVRNSVVFEDNDIIALNKPSGIVVHSGSGRSFGVIEVMRKLRPTETALQLVHRLDQETSGCLLLAKNTRVLKHLHAALTNGEIRKEYTALLKGSMECSPIEIDKPMLKSIDCSGERFVEVSKQGKYAQTRFESIRQFQQATLVKVLIATGRTHQIRVHAQYLQHPIAGDKKYGDKAFNKVLKGESGLKRLFLHASSLRLPSLRGNKQLHIKAPLPNDLKHFLAHYV